MMYVPSSPLLSPSSLSEEPACANPSLGLRISLSASWDCRLLNQLCRVRDANRGDMELVLGSVGVRINARFIQSRDKSDLGIGDPCAPQKLLALFLCAWTELHLCNHGDSLCILV